MNDLLTKISNLFKKYGLKSVTMDDIARVLGMSKKNLYQHFENKNDVVHKVAQFEIKNECDELDRLCIENTHVIDQLMVVSKYIVSKNQAVNSSLIYSMNKYYPKVWEEMSKQRKEHILNIITNNFHTGIKQGIYRENLNFDIFQIFYSFLLDIKSIEMYGNWFNKDFDKIFNTIFLYHVRGIANNAGIEYFEKKYHSV